jgi:hypothetical protein
MLKVGPRNVVMTRLKDAGTENVLQRLDLLLHTDPMG